MIVGVTMIRDEADIVRRSMTHMLGQVDQVIALDNGSADGTRDVLDELARDHPLSVREDPERGYFQSVKMSALAAEARELGARWVVAFDADELWEATDGRRVADVLTELPEPILVAEAALYDHVATAADSGDADPVARIGWRRWEALGLPKVACRAVEGLTIHQGNHSAAFPHVNRPPAVTGLLRVRHFPYRSPEQFVRKAVNGGAAYAATNLDEGIGAHWRMYAAMIAEHGEQAGEDWFREHFYVEDPESDPTLIYDPAP